MQRRLASHTADAHEQMTVDQQSMEDALDEARTQKLPLYVFVSWPPSGEAWRSRIELIAADQIEELSFLQPHPVMYGGAESEMVSSRFRTTELFPKTLCRDDFLAKGLGGADLGLYHSQLFVLTPRN